MTRVVQHARFVALALQHARLVARTVQTRFMALSRNAMFVALAVLTLMASGCGTGFVLLPIETGFSYTNLSTRFYAALQIRAHDPLDEEEWFESDLLSPGATQRERFLDALGASCPDRLDLRVLLYRRVNDELPIGLDEGETVMSRPVAAGAMRNVPACGVAVVETYTIVVWDAPEGEGRVKLAQNTPIEDHFRRFNIFPGVDAAWGFSGVAAELAEVEPPSHAALLPIAGRVQTAAGAGVEGVGVLVRARFRVRLDDNNPSNDPDAGFGDPILFTTTDAEGRFDLTRPGGAYRVEFFSDDFAFRPAEITVETPLERISVVAEPL